MAMLRKVILCCTLLLYVASSAGQHISAVITDKIVQLRSGQLTIRGQHIGAYAPIIQFYADVDYTPLWTEPMLDQLQEAIAFVAAEGLLPADYHLSTIQQLRTQQSGDSVAAAELDILASDAFVLLQFHLLNGKVHPIAVDPNCHLEHQEGDLFAWLPQLRQTGKVVEAIQEARPHHPQYYRLLQAYFQLAERQERIPPWPSSPASLRLGDTSDRVVTVREILYAWGDLSDTGASSLVFDSTLLEGVLRFQERHGLEVDGIIGRATQQALAKPLVEKMAQLQANMERWRWLPQQLPADYGLVNIPAFMLYMTTGTGTQAFEVIVGRKDRMTPTFTAQFSYLILNPTWTVPPTILREDVLPAVRRNPAYLAGKRIKVIAPNGHELNPYAVNWYSTGVYSYQYVQDPGPHNSLGLIKFMMPNPYTVYLHDTPSKELFQRTSRLFSSGCIRVNHPFQLANLLLHDQPAWTTDSMQTVLESGNTTIVNLSYQPALFVVYLTNWQHDEGKMHYYPDVYALDEALIKALQRPARYW